MSIDEFLNVILSHFLIKLTPGSEVVKVWSHWQVYVLVLLVSFVLTHLAPLEQEYVTDVLKGLGLFPISSFSSHKRRHLSQVDVDQHTYALNEIKRRILTIIIFSRKILCGDKDVPFFFPHNILI